MNKSLLTNLVALIAVIAGILVKNDILLTIGLFTLSGTLTNWLAVYMLFEKVPGLGVIPARFEDFKLGIKALMMEQFFTKENIERFLSAENGKQPDLHLAPVIEIVQRMIREHLDWLGVWGGVFGGLIGLIAALLRI